MSRPTLVRIALFLATVVAAWGVLSLGTSTAGVSLEVGMPSPQTFVAERSAEVLDVETTERRREEARAAVDDDDARQTQPEIESTVQERVQSVFDDLEALVIAEPPSVEVVVPPLPTTTTTTTEPPAEGEATAGDETEPEVADYTGRVFIDVDGDGTYQPDLEAERTDSGLEELTVTIITHDGETMVTTDSSGTWTFSQEGGGPIVAVVDLDDPAIPEGFIPASEELAQVIDCDGGDQCAGTDVAFQINLRPLSDVEVEIAARHPIPSDTISYLVSTAADDVMRAALGEPEHLDNIRQAALTRVLEEFGRRITERTLPEAEARQRSSPPLVFHRDTGQDLEGGEAAGEIVATYLQANYLINQTLLEQMRSESAAQVEPVFVPFTEGQVIVRDGEIVTQLAKDAVEQTTSLTSSEPASIGLLVLIAVLVSLLGLYLSRFRPEFWARPRMVALLGILVLLASAAVRFTTVIEESTSLYVLPAVAFGFMTAILFDQRIAVLMALTVGVLTAAGTLDLGITVYGSLAALAPIPFVSALSSRGSFRDAVLLSSLAAAAIAGASSWFFQAGLSDVTTVFLGMELPLTVIGISMAWAFGVSIIASLVGIAALQFFESAFDITTTLSLLDLTDRNHEALQLLQEKAFGTFNHSLMVGTLADAAARAIGANPLLARAMAYYHDLGKTQNPTFFIENQFGASNPHDELDPAESAEVIRGHVTAGVALARQFRIPTEVTQGIVSHHGDGVMRYFYEKARQIHGDEVNIDDFRHVGHKPRTAETAILMLADSLEAACRAVFQTEEPSPDSIEKVVDRIINEKLEDGQLSEAPLTLAELTKIRRAFLESLIGHYHQRIAYPNFPGS